MGKIKKNNFESIYTLYKIWNFLAILSLVFFDIIFPHYYCQPISFAW